MLKERLLNKNFYLDHMSMFLKDSFGIIDREETYRANLINVNKIADDIISRYDIYNLLFEEDYFTRNNIDPTSTEDVWLDNIADIFGIQRTFNIKYKGVAYGGDSTHYGPAGSWVNETITLTNKQLYLYIKIMITKLNYQGTAGEIIDLYKNDPDIDDLKIYYSWGDASLNCDVYLCNTTEIYDNGNYNSSIVKMFLADLFLIESLGVVYNKQLTLAAFRAVFDANNVPDIANHIYLFDPDFSDTNSAFKYGVFS